MNYKSYSLAAERHLKNCQYNLLQLTRGELLDVPTQRAIEKNTIYLGGYVIECMFSYALLHSLSYNPDKSIYEIKGAPFKGLKWEKYFSTHSAKCQMQKYERFIKELSGAADEIELVYQKWNESDEFQKIYSNWDSKFRYSCELNVHLKELKVFIELLNSMFQKIKKL